MKKIISLFLLTTVLLAGCGEQTVSEVPQDTGNRFNGVDANISIVTDSETGCKYIYIDKGVADNRVMAISPLMKSARVADCD